MIGAWPLSYIYQIFNFVLLATGKAASAHMTCNHFIIYIYMRGGIENSKYLYIVTIIQQELLSSFFDNIP